MNRLIVFAGLPGTGESTLARALAGEIGAVWIRVDSGHPRGGNAAWCGRRRRLPCGVRDGAESPRAGTRMVVTVQLGFGQSPCSVAATERPDTSDAVAATVRVVEHIQRRYASGRGADEFVVEMLADLRHFCDSHALPFAKLEQRAQAHYLTERTAGNGAKDTPAREQPAVPYVPDPASGDTAR
jgi:hypothetical protein